MSQTGSAGFGKYYGSEGSDYQFVTEAEKYFEKQYTKYSAGDKLGLLNVVALISLAFGVRSTSEIFVGAVGFVPHYLAGGDGLDGLISAMTGVQLYKKRWKSVAFPLILETLRTMKDFTKGKVVTKLGISRTLIFVGGYVAAMSRMV